MTEPTTKIVSPIEWIAHWMAEHAAGRWNRPLVYVAHPVAPRAGEQLATCTECAAEHVFGKDDPLDLRLVCDHDAPVKHTSDADRIVAFNLRRAMRWWKWFHLGLSGAAFIMPWYVNVSANGDADPALVERGLLDDEQCVMRCDAIVNCGERISSGMKRETEAAHDCGADVFQVRGFRGEHPAARSARDVAWVQLLS